MMHRFVIAIDPGSERSACLCYDTETPDAPILRAVIEPNADVARWLRSAGYSDPPDTILVVETFRPRGQPLYRQLIDTAIWIGRFVEAWSGPHVEVVRDDAKRHVLGTSKGSDANVRAALIDRWGGKERAIGKKATPGPLHGIKADLFAALAVAVTYVDGAARLAASAEVRSGA